MEQTYMKEEPVLRLVIKMSLPMIISMMVNSLYNIIDSFFVAKISQDAMTALSLIFPLQNLINAITIGFGVGVNAVISIHLGAQNQENADNAAAHGFILSILQGLALSVITIAMVPAFLKSFNVSDSVYSFGIEYADITFAFAIGISLNLYYEKIYQALGKMSVTMYCLMLGCIVNIILDPVFIFGFGFIPRMEIKGAAIATVIGQAASLAGYLIFKFLRPISLKAKIKGFKWNLKTVKQLYGIGVPAMLNMALPSILISALNAILAPFSEVYIFVLGIYYKLQTFLYLTANGIIQGIRPLAGYNFGAGEKERVKEIFITALKFTGGIMIIGTVLFSVLPENLVKMFSKDAETVKIGAQAFRIISIGFVFSSVSVVVSGVLEGIGKGMPSLVISLSRYIIFIIPAAYIFTKISGPAALWNGFWISEIVTCIISVFLYKKALNEEKQI